MEVDMQGPANIGPPVLLWMSYEIVLFMSIEWRILHKIYNTQKENEYKCWTS